MSPDTGFGFNLQDGDWTRVRQLFQLIGSSLRLGTTGVGRFAGIISEGDLMPATDNAYDIGETTTPLRWKNIECAGSGRFDGGVGIGIAPDALTLSIYGNSASPVSAILDNAGAGDVLVRFRLGGTSLFVLGVDNDDDKFKIATGTFLGTNTSLTIDSSGNFVIPGTITGGAYNTLHIIPGTGATGQYYVYLSSTGVEDDGFTIGIPNTATKGFKYGDDGTEHHFFGNTGQVEITDDGIVNAVNFTAGTLTVSDGSIDDTDGSIAFGATNFTGVGTIASSDVTITGAGTNPALRINQGGDSKGIYIYGFDDHNDKRIDMYVNSSGFGIVNSATDWYFTYDEGLRLLIRNFYVASYVDFVVLDDLLTVFGEDRDYGLGYYNTDDELQLVDGHAINTNVRMTMDASGNFDFKTGEVLFGNKITLTQKAGTTTDGDLWNDSTQEALQTFVSGIEQTLVGVIFTQTADQTIANTTTETTMFGSGVGTLALPANFWTVGKTIRVEIHGDFADTGNPTAEIQAYYGATSLIDSGAITLSGLGGTEEWECEVIITCRTAGASGALQTVINWEYETTTGSSAIERLDVAGVLTSPIDLTASGALDATFQWGTAAAANTIHSHVAFVEVLN